MIASIAGSSPRLALTGFLGLVAAGCGTEAGEAVAGSADASAMTRVTGDVAIGSNKTLVGACGAVFHGHLGLSGSANVIVRNLTIVGYNCTDSPSDCSGGADAVTLQKQSHHVWFDHDDISDGSDGNLD